MIESSELMIGNLVNREYWNPRPGKEGYAYDTCIVCRVNIKSADVQLSWELGKGSILTKQEVFPVNLSEKLLQAFGFQPIPHFTIMNSFTLDLGRDRQLSLGCVGTPNEMLYLQEVDLEAKKVNDLICLWNWDYDGKLYAHQLQNIYHSITKKQLKLK